MFWPLQLSSEVWRVPEDSQVPISGVWVSSSHSLNVGLRQVLFSHFILFWKTFGRGEGGMRFTFSLFVICFTLKGERGHGTLLLLSTRTHGHLWLHEYFCKKWPTDCEPSCQRCCSFCQLRTHGHLWMHEYFCKKWPTDWKRWKLGA
jgi:hypothetical protein